jgi:hypothetical protein
MGGSSGSRPTLLRFGCGFFLWHHNDETTILLTFDGGDGPQRAGNGGVLWLSLASVWVSSGAPPATGRAPTGVMNSGEALGAVGSAWVTMHQRGNESSG